MRLTYLALVLWIVSPGLQAQNQIIADHTIVNDYQKIPQHYIDEVKKMLVSIPGASHSTAYQMGLAFLEQMDARFAVNIAYEEAYTTNYLRCNDIGRDFLDDEWYTWYAWPVNERPATANSVKDMIRRNNENNRNLTAIGFGWCWIMMSSYLSRIYDPVYNVRWWGSTRGGPDAGSLGWGLDAEDYAITGNRVSLDTYLEATEEYMNYCKTNNYPTKILFTTGPVDKYVGEQAYQTYIKHEKIRAFVKENPERILFDYADILCYDNDGTLNTESYTYNGITYTFPFITDTNLGDETVGHIGREGALRLAKALWWLLARIAGWDGSSTPVVDIGNQPSNGYNSYQNNGQLIIELDTPLIFNRSYAIQSIDGILQLKQPITSNPIIINTRPFNPGVYVITLEGIKTTCFKVIIPQS